MNNQEGSPGVHYYPFIAQPSQPPRSRAAKCDTVALYIHIPFCDKRCYFCEFAVVAGKSVTDSLVNEYLLAVRSEMRTFLATADYPPAVELIQFGGGTPTALRAQALDDLLGFIFEQFDCSTLKEVIIEGFPNSISDERIAILERVPNLKLNIGVQSFHSECLESVGREHGAKAEEAITRAVGSKIRSVGVDLIFGLPFSTSAIVRSDIEKSHKLGAEHCALYPLWIYEKTALDSRVRSGKVALPDRSLQREQLYEGTAEFVSLGYERYTAFHYSLNEAARHRYGLWQMLSGDWVGFGMSAMTHLNGEVFFNDRNIRSYIDKTKLGASTAIQSYRMPSTEQKRFVFLYGLRLKRYSTSLFSDRFGVSLEEVFGEELRNLEQQGLLTHAEGSIALTFQGILALGAIEDYVNGTCDALALEDQLVAAHS